MKYLVAAPVVLFMLWLAVGAVTGRVEARSCCSIPADRDLRLRDAGVPAATSSRAVPATTTTSTTTEGAVPAGVAGTTPPQA